MPKTLFRSRVILETLVRGQKEIIIKNKINLRISFGFVLFFKYTISFCTSQIGFKFGAFSHRTYDIRVNILCVKNTFGLPIPNAAVHTNRVFLLDEFAEFIFVKPSLTLQMFWIRIN